MRCYVTFVQSLFALLTIVIFTDARAPKKLLSSTNASLGEVRYQVSLQRNNYNACGGALISESHILTAAHCFVGRALPPYTEGLVILTGATSLTSGGEHHYAKYVTVHPEYVKGDSKNHWRHDIAVITLVTPAVTNTAQAPVALPTSNITTNVSAVVSGWGTTRRGSGGNYPKVLQKSSVTILTQEDCNSRNPILETQLCGLDGKGTGFCDGDSGGPLVYNNEIIGVVSYAISCGLGYPDVYTRVWPYKDFIVDAMKRK